MTDAKTPKPITLGKFKPLLAGTSLARICTAALPGKYTAAEIAKAAGLREDQVTHRLRHGLGVAHGIGHNRDEAGVVTIVLPDGVRPRRWGRARRRRPVSRRARGSRLPRPRRNQQRRPPTPLP